MKDLFLPPFSYSDLIQQKRKYLKMPRDPKGTPIRVAILSGSTIGEIRNILHMFLRHYGMEAEFFVGDYGQYYEDAMYPNEGLEAFSPTVIYIHTTVKNLHLAHLKFLSEGALMEKVETEMLKIREMHAHLYQKYACPIFCNNFEFPDYRIWGDLEATMETGRIKFLDRLNERLHEYINETPYVHLNDIRHLSARMGLDKWYSAKDWHMYKYGLSLMAIPYLCHHLALGMRDMYGKAKKCIVVDLDNTLWQGVVGEVGQKGIEIGHETPVGQAYLAFHQYLKQLSQRGILLCVSSKNERENALAGLNHPESLLRPEDFLIIQADWRPKSQHLEEIARSLNVLPESMVFIDDNPAECEEVLRHLPQVSVLWADAIEDIIEKMDQLSFFNHFSVAEEDKKRGDYYRQNLKREAYEQTFDDYEAYLRSLDMKAQILPFQQMDLGRITQLINKTNQFNVTTRRYTEAQVDEVLDQKHFITLQGRLEDRFGDNGIVSLLIGRIEEKALWIELWVMSCRVFKRDLEKAMLDRLVSLCNERDLTTIYGVYLPTPKNKYVEQLYARLGFQLVAQEKEKSIWSLSRLSSYEEQNQVMEVTNESGNVSKSGTNF